MFGVWPASEFSAARIATIDIAAYCPSGDVTLGSGWRPGPLPLALGSTIRADASSRSTYLRPEAARLLFGRPEDPTRWWQRRPSAFAGDPWALELVRAPSLSATAPNRYFAIAHATWTSPEALGQDENPLKHTSEALRVGLSLTGLQPAKERGHIANHRLTFLTTLDGVLPVAYPDITTATTTDQWLWLLATHAAHSLSTFAYGTEPDDLRLAEHVSAPARIQPSAQWAALTLRDGSAIVGLEPDLSNRAAAGWSTRNEVNTPESFFDYLEIYTRTIYTDALVLGQAQRWCLSDLSHRMSADLGTGRELVQVTRQIELDVVHFRHRIWTPTASAGGVADLFLKAQQWQHHSAERLGTVADAAAELSRVTAREQERRLNGSLALLATVGFPIASCLTAAQLLAPSTQTQTERAWTLLLALLAALIVTILLLLVFSGLLSALTDSLPDRRSSDKLRQRVETTGQTLEDG